MSSRPPSARLQPELVEQVLDEFYALPQASGNEVLDAVLTAVFVEDAFGVTLPDAEITPAHLSDRATVRATVLRHLAS